jgi:hypothetical protein
LQSLLSVPLCCYWFVESSVQDFNSAHEVKAMKRLLRAIGLSLMALVSYGQGQVVFGNYGGGVNAPIMYADTGHGPGLDFTAQLYLQAGNGLLTPLLPTTTFRTAGSGAQAIADRYLVTKTVDVPGVAPGNPATFIIRTWKTSLGSFEAAVASTACEYGFSQPVTVVVGGGQFPPANLVGLQGLSVSGCPEPSTLALGALGVVLLLFVRRK